jgi:hypothetical protein
MKKSDILVIILVFALAGILLLADHVRSNAQTSSVMIADVYVDGELNKSISLTKEEKTIEIDTD